MQPAFELRVKREGETREMSHRKRRERSKLFEKVEQLRRRIEYFYSEQILDGELAFVFLTCVLILEFFFFRYRFKKLFSRDFVQRHDFIFVFSFKQIFAICKYMSCSSKNSLSLLGAAPTT